MSNISSEKLLSLKGSPVNRWTHIFRTSQAYIIVEQDLIANFLNQTLDFIDRLYLVSISKVHMGKTLKSATL